MKSQIVFFIGVIFVCVESRPEGDAPGKAKEGAQILKYDSEVKEDGYSFSFETSDPIKRSETGQITPGAAAPEGRSLDGEKQEHNSILKVNGDFGFDFPEKIPFYVIFVADENGYRPKVSFGTAAQRPN